MHKLFATALLCLLTGCEAAHAGYRGDGGYSSSWSNSDEDAAVLTDTNYSGPVYESRIVDCSSTGELVARLNKYGKQGWKPSLQITGGTAIVTKQIK